MSDTQQAKGRIATPPTPEEFTEKEMQVIAASQPPIHGTMRFWLGELNQIFFGQVQIGRIEERSREICVYGTRDANGDRETRDHQDTIYEYRGGVFLPDGKHLQTGWHKRPCEVFWELREEYYNRFPAHGECEDGYYTRATGEEA